MARLYVRERKHVMLTRRLEAGSKPKCGMVVAANDYS